MNYYSVENVVYGKGGEVVCVIAPVWLLRGIAWKMAQQVATQLNEWAMDECDVLRGSLD